MKSTACANCGTPNVLRLQEDDDSASGTGEVVERGNRTSSTVTACTFFKTGACSEAIMNVVNRAFNNPMPLEEHGVMPLAGGIAAHGYQCGMLWGATLAAGAQARRRLGTGPAAQLAALRAAARLVQSFQERNGQTNCFELTDTDWSRKLQMLRYFIRGGPSLACSGRLRLLRLPSTRSRLRSTRRPTRPRPSKTRTTLRRALSAALRCW